MDCVSNPEDDEDEDEFEDEDDEPRTPNAPYGAIFSAISNLPPFTLIISPGFEAFRFASNEIWPVTPPNPAVSANASRKALESGEPARLIASASKRAAS